MLKSLSIFNYVIIEKAELHFDGGLNMLTGETGAGKSIILGALGLVLGKRADTQVLLNPKSKAIVEAVFDDPGSRLDDLYAQLEIDRGTVVILRREIAATGRSRAFINDTPVTLDAMTAIGAALVDIHEQFETLEIQQSREQFNILDAWCHLQDAMASYQQDYTTLTELESRLSVLREKQADALREKDYLTFQLNEFAVLPLEPGGLAAMEEEYQLQMGSEEIKGVIQQTMQLLEGDPSLTDALAAQMRTLSKLADGNTRLAGILERMEEILDLSHDLVQTMSHFNDQLDPDPIRRRQLEEKLDVINRIMLKHGARDEQSLMEVRNALEEQLDAWTNLDAEVEKCEKAVTSLQKSLLAQARKISQKRTAEAPELAKQVSHALHQLAMKHAKLDIAISDAGKLHPYGIDTIEFLFTPNLGSEPKPIRKVASGGELARLNLCLKSAVSDRMQLPTLVFDEIDAGVSGEVAMRMGQQLRSLAGRHQVIMITHSPQIAAQAGNHLQVSKTDVNGRTIAIVRALPKPERITEIAKMLSGDPPTKAAIQNAKNLIET